MTFFNFSKKTEKIEGYPFNFYVFPRESAFSDPVVSLQAGCVEFNSSQEMDWNRWIKKGVTYMKLSEYNNILDGIEFNSKSSKTLLEYMDVEQRTTAEEIIRNISRKEMQNN